RPDNISVAYEKFRYPVTKLRGKVKRTVVNGGPPSSDFDLVGMAGGQPITITGKVEGDGDDPGIDLRIAGANVPLDETLVKAFPHKYAEMVRKFRATGRGDFIAKIVQQPGVNLCENEFQVDIREGSLKHEEFPYPLEKVKGRLVIRNTVSSPSRGLRPGEPA